MADSGAHKIRLHPRTWPIAVKLVLALTIAALLPMLLVSYYNLRGSLAVTAEGEYKELEQLATSTGARIDQLIKDTRHTIAYLSWSEEAINLVQSPTEKNRAAAEDKMSRLIAANEDLELLMVLDASGKVLAASKPNYVNRVLGFRDYFKEAITGKNFISDLEVGTATNEPGMYFSSPARNHLGRIGGVVVLKLKGSAVISIMEELRSRESTLSTFLIDDDGIILYHSDKRATYSSLAPVPEDIVKKMIDEKQFGATVTSIPSLGLKELAEKMLRAKQPDHHKMVSPLTNQPEIVGFAPLILKNWTIAVSESEDSYSVALRQLFNNAVLSVVLVGFVFVVLAVLFARTFTRPISDLTDAAAAVENGDYENANVRVSTEDELGRLAGTFNAMIDGVKSRQRELAIFGRMVSPAVRDKLLSGELKLGGENLRVSVLFSDIRGFSTMSEKMSPNDVVVLLNEYFTEMEEVVRPWGGNVNNFIGDAIVVVFGAPEARGDNEWNVIQAALAMKARLATFNQRRAEMGDPPLRTGIGIATGKVVAGQIGSPERMMYTVIGDAVNVAARLEELTKQFDGNPILMNALTYEGCSKKSGEVIFDDKGLQAVKGRVEPVHVYGVHAEQNTVAVPAAEIASPITS
jgi:adenylate cyclase